MKLIFFKFLLIIIFTYKSFASEFPISSDITYGKLENGLTYYIRENSKPEDKAEIRLYVKAGSIQEREDQQGLAHLLEHMAFNGSKDFPKNKIDTFFNSIGLSIGADFNAHTSFNETVYKFKVPTKEEKHIETGIHILSDIAGFLDLEPEAFERERKIVEQEWRGGLSSGERIFRKRLEYLYKNSIYKNRLPIGKIDVIRTFEYQTVIDYYKTWYRPDLMAVMVVGDIDAKKVEAFVKKYFSRIPKPKTPLTETNSNIPDYGKTQYKVITDAEQESTRLRLINKHKRFPIDTRESYRTYLIEKLAIDLFQKRLDSLENDLIFGYYIGNNQLGESSQLYSIAASLNENKIPEAIQFLNKKIQECEKYGFLDEEIKIGKKEILTHYLQSLSNEKTRKSRSYFKELIGHFTENEMISGIEYENKLVKELIPSISKNEVNQAFKKFVLKDNNIIEFITADKNQTKIPNQKQYLELTKFNKLQPFQLTLAKGTLIKKELKKKKITSKKFYPSINTTEIKLENGIKVLFRPSDAVNDQIYFEAKSFGGYSQERDLNKLPAARFSTDIASYSGLAGKKYGALNYRYPSEFVGVNLTISNLYEGIEGSTFEPYLKDMFELIYLNFTDMYFYENAFNQFKEAKIEEIRNKKLSSKYNFFTKTDEEFYLNHPRQKSFTTKMIQNMKLDDVKDFYKDRFSDASDFVFVFTGDFDVKEITNFAQIYLANLPTLNRKESYIDHNIQYFDDYKTLEFKDNTDPNASGVRTYTEKFKFNPKERMTYYMFEDIINRLAFEKIREELNYVYSIRFMLTHMEKYPDPQIASLLYFESDPKNVKKVFEAFDDIVEDFKKGNFKNKYFQDAKTKRLLRTKQSLKGNSIWTGGLLDYTFNQENIQIIGNLETVIQSISKRDVVRIANQLLDKNYIQSVLLPKD